MPMSQVPDVSDRAPSRQGRKLEGRVKQEVTRIEKQKQTRAREESVEEPPKQRPRVVQDGAPSRPVSSASPEDEGELLLRMLREAEPASSTGAQYHSHSAQQADVRTTDKEEESQPDGSTWSWLGLHSEPVHPAEVQYLQTWMTKEGRGPHGSAQEHQAEKGPVVVSRLPERWRLLFERGSRVKEGTSVLPSMTPLTEKEAREIESQKPERVMSMRWLDSWKQTDEAVAGNMELGLPHDLAAKSRIVVQGFSDPDFRCLEADAPTPELSELTTVLQAMASQQMEISIADVSAAFNQSTSGQRHEAVYGRVPREGVPGLPQGTRL
eukprot:3054783-Amphidinium_carterae.1